MTRTGLCVVAAVLSLAACDLPQQPASEVHAGRQFANTNALLATGGGYYLLVGAFPMQFSVSAVQGPNGEATGVFHQKGDVDGIWVDVRGRVTCLAVDRVNHRAWIAGVVTENRSDPDLQEDIHQPGRDVWFRAVDYGSGSDTQPDRTTFLGFEGAAGIITSDEYCAARLWPEEDARTHPVTSGNLRID